VLDEVLGALAEDLKERGGLDLSECFVDGTFSWGRKRGRVCGKDQARGKGLRCSWRWQTLLVFLSPYARRALARTRSRS
jgi:hypothetical protein